MSSPGQPTRSTGGAYNPASVRIRIRVAGAGAPPGLPGPGVGGAGGGDVIVGPGGGGGGGGIGGGIGGGGMPRLPLIGAAPYSRIGHVAKPSGPIEIAQAIREAGVWDILSQLNEDQKRIVIKMNLMERRIRREGIQAGERAEAKPYMYKRPDTRGLGEMYEKAEGITHQEFLKDDALARQETERTRALRFRTEDSATRRAHATFQREHARQQSRTLVEGRRARTAEFKERLATEASASNRADMTFQRAHAQEAARILREGRKAQEAEFKDRMKTEASASKQAYTTFQREHAKENERVLKEGRKALEREFKGRLAMEGRVLSRAERDRHKVSILWEAERRAEEEAADKELFMLAVQARHINAIENVGFLQEFADVRLKSERRLRAVRTLSQRHSAYGAFFVASAQLNPTQTISRVLLNSLIRSGPVGAAIGTTAAIGLSIEPVIHQTLQTFGKKGLPLNQDYRHFFSEQTVGFFSLEEQKRHDLGLAGRIADPNMGYEPVSGTAVYNSQQVANVVRLTKLADQEKARRLN